MINWEKANTHAHVTSPNAGVLSTFEYDVRIGNAIKTKKKILIGMINFFSYLITIEILPTERPLYNSPHFATYVLTYRLVSLTDPSLT